MSKKHKKVSLLFSVVFSFCFAIPLAGQAAVLYLDPAEGSYRQADTFALKIRIDTQGQCVNVVEAGLSFPKDILHVADISKGGSIVTFWALEPRVYQKEGLISFVGGVPGGYCGRIIGDPGESDLLFRVFFRTAVLPLPETPADFEINFLPGAKVLLNDGFATPAKVELSGAKARLLPEVAQEPQTAWQEELKKDIIPPEPFSVKIAKDPLTFEGKWFAAFHTIDNQTGIDYYEIKEGAGPWKKAKSPYLLENQRLTGAIQVRALDKAGNEQIAEYKPEQKPLPYWIVILILAGLGTIFWAAVKMKRSIL